MKSFWTKVIGDKKEWRGLEARADALPRDYRVMYREIKQYLFKLGSGDAQDVVRVLDDVVGLFETGAADGKRVLDVTGEDVAAFCDERLAGVSSYTDRWRASLNRDVAKKLGTGAPR